MEENKSESKISPLRIVMILAVLGALVIVVIVSSLKTKLNNPANTCMINLWKIDAAKNQWALENNASSTNGVNWSDVKPYLERGSEGYLKNFFLSVR